MYSPLGLRGLKRPHVTKFAGGGRERFSLKLRLAARPLNFVAAILQVFSSSFGRRTLKRGLVHLSSVSFVRLNIQSLDVTPNSFCDHPFWPYFQGSYQTPYRRNCSGGTRVSHNVRAAIMECAPSLELNEAMSTSTAESEARFCALRQHGASPLKMLLRHF